ncbi:IncF plasmid conjugative transfer pilus assembly protein TraF (plasmid) [Rhodovastum atsumiense]|nr:IncF plasmid conjugative transfer pilus assembly protein TraF [Rhodovastum atsumiense]
MNHRKGRRLAAVAVLALLVGVDVAGAQEELPGREWLSRGREGWFWYRDPAAEPVDPPLPPSPPPMPVAVSPVPPVQPSVTPFTRAEPLPLSVAWFRQNLDTYRDAAIDNPTPGNVRRFLILQRIMMDKSTAFRRTFQEVVATTPALDANTERPLDSVGANTANEVASTATQMLLRSLAQTVGLVYFFRSDCPLCGTQVESLEAAQRLYGFTVLYVSLDGSPMPRVALRAWAPDAGQAQRMGVKDAPALVLMRPPGEFLVLSESVLSLPAIAERTLLRARLAGWISEDDYRATRPVRERSFLSLANGITPDLLEDPEKFSGYIAAHMEDRQ